MAALQSAAAEQAAFAAADLAKHVAASEAALASARRDAAAAAARAQQASNAAAVCAASEAAVREEGLRAQVREAVARAAGEAAAKEAVQLQLGDALAAEGPEEPASLAAVEAEVERLNALLQDSTAEVAALRAVVLAQCQEREGWHGAQGQGRPVHDAQGSPEQRGVQELGCGASTSNECKHGLGGEQSIVGDPGAGARWATARPARAVRQRLGRHFVA